MLVEFENAYLILTIPFVIGWIVLFIASKNTRKEQLIMSFLCLPLGTISEILYFKDYWKPGSILSFNLGSIPILIEDFLFTFSIVGVGAVIYEALFYKKFFRIERKIRKIPALFLIFIIGAIVSWTFFLLGINSIFATSLGGAVAGLFVISQRKDLLMNSLMSGLAVMFIMFISYSVLLLVIVNAEDIYLRQIWLLHGTFLDIRISNIPITELIWGFAVGMFIGPLYEFAKGLRTRSF